MIRPTRDPDDGSDDAGAAGPRRRRRWFAAVALGAVLVSVVGLLLSTRIKSPAQAAADAEPPAASEITAGVESRVLATSVVVRGSVSQGTTYSIVPGTAQGALRLVVSDVRLKPGDSASAGTVLAVVSGRPVFLLHGAVPAYRDLKPGDTGDDVAQLQSALKELGHSAGSDRVGTFGAGTKKALEKLYGKLGAPPPTTGDETRKTVEAAKAAVEQAQKTVDELRRPQTTAPTPAAGAAPAPAPGTGTASGSPSDEPSSGTGTGGGKPQSPGRGADALADARKELTDAKAKLAEAELRDGVMLPIGEALFVPQLPVQVVAVGGRVGLPVSGPVLTLAAGEPRLTGRLNPVDRPLVKPGTRVEIRDDASGTVVAGTVTGLGNPTDVQESGDTVVLGGDGKAAAPSADSPQSQQSQQSPQAPNQQGALFVPVHVQPEKPLPADLAGRDVTIVVVSAATEGPVLCVPLAAISTGADTRPVVTVVAADGRRDRVPVTAGASADGFVEVRADPGRLAVGMRVVVGR